MQLTITPACACPSVWADIMGATEQWTHTHTTGVLHKASWWVIISLTHCPWYSITKHPLLVHNCFPEPDHHTVLGRIHTESQRLENRARLNGFRHLCSTLIRCELRTYSNDWLLCTKQVTLGLSSMQRPSWLGGWCNTGAGGEPKWWVCSVHIQQDLFLVSL